MSFPDVDAVLASRNIAAGDENSRLLVCTVIVPPDFSEADLPSYMAAVTGSVERAFRQAALS